MDKGAHFLRADFQIHSPRDPQWGGETRPVKQEDRLAYAKRFIRRCRELEVQAIAITDHHDIEFIKYYQYAAMDARPAFDKLSVVDPSKQNPVIFPGIEVTLKGGSQAIVLLNPHSAEDLQIVLLNVMGKYPHDKNDGRGPEIVQLDWENIDELHKRLSKNEALCGQYIILANVNDGGKHSHLREGFGQKYACLPCEGGYVDGVLLNHRKLHILEGQDPNWGNKAVGVFQTSDFRGKPDEYFGDKCTWVKVAVPTVEGLRQACLARQSRIRHSYPTLPSIYLERIQVTNSLFLGEIDISFNPQLNVLIGGRGTGKTSLLEYIRYAMQDQPAVDPDDPGLHDEISQKRNQLIKQTLLDIRGHVTLSWTKNGVLHAVGFDTVTGKPTLSIGSDPPLSVTPEQLREILPIQAYSQKQLSTVGTRTRELQRFIEQPIQQELLECGKRADEKKRMVEQLYDELTDLNEKNKTLNALRTKLSSFQQQAKSTEESLPRLSADLEKALLENPLRLREKQVMEQIDGDLRSTRSAISGVLKSLEHLPRSINIDPKSPQQTIIRKIHTDVGVLVQSVRESLELVQKTLLEGGERVAKDIDTWQVAHQYHESLYARAASEAKEHREKLDLIKQLRGEEAIVHGQIEDLVRQMVVLESTREAFNKNWEEWGDIYRERGDILEKACKMLNKKSDGEIEAELRRGADIGNALKILNDTLRGCNIREQNWLSLEQFLLTGNPAQNWFQLMRELRPLAEMSKEEIPSDGTVPNVPIWPLTQAMCRNIVERLSPRRWLDIALTALEDLPVFHYKGKDTERIEFKNASAGQQATALLKVLLKESTGPLMIDQPEEDLDNAIIQQITEELWKAKERRQIIFSSHNANIVVNGDAELVIHCDYRKERDRTKGHIAGEGAIDVAEIRDAIKRVMEGGEKAFELRRRKYGFNDSPKAEKR